jgi:hypothetical protein
LENELHLAAVEKKQEFGALLLLMFNGGGFGVADMKPFKVRYYLDQVKERKGWSA